MESFSTLHNSLPSARANTARVKTGSSLSAAGEIMLALEGFKRDDATLTSIEGSAFGGRSRPGYSSETNPLKMVSSTGLGVLLLALESARPVAFFDIINGFGEISCSPSPLANPGDASDIGVPGGKGIGCLGARGDNGIAEPSIAKLLGDMGGEAIEELWDDSRGFRGNGDAMALSIGLGLRGRPGLMGGAKTSCTCGLEPESKLALNIPAKDPAIASDPDRWRESAGGAIWIVRGLDGIRSSELASFGVPFALPVFGLFFDKLRNSASR